MMRSSMLWQHRLRRCSRTFETSPLPRFGEVSSSHRPAITSGTWALTHAGTVHAINYTIIGGSPLIPECANRGGARNRADRTSDVLSETQVANLTAAARHAYVIGLPFTRMITIHWEAAGVPLDRIAKATGRFIDLMTKALARLGSRTAWIWVHENGDDKGCHCHLLAHVPAQHVKRLTRLHRGWLKRITGKPYKARVIRSIPIGRRLNLENSNPNRHSLNLHTVLAYVLKQASRTAVVRFKLERWEPGGRVIGKRCGTSMNIGPSARKSRE